LQSRGKKEGNHGGVSESRETNGITKGGKNWIKHIQVLSSAKIPVIKLTTELEFSDPAAHSSMGSEKSQKEKAGKSEKCVLMVDITFDWKTDSDPSLSASPVQMGSENEMGSNEGSENKSQNEGASTTTCEAQENPNNPNNLEKPEENPTSHDSSEQKHAKKHAAMEKASRHNGTVLVFVCECECECGCGCVCVCPFHEPHIALSLVYVMIDYYVHAS